MEQRNVVIFFTQKEGTGFAATLFECSIHEPDRNVPKWYKLEPTMLLGRVVGRTSLAAFGTNALRILSGFHLGNNDFRLGFILTKNVIVNFRENEGLVIGDKIEYLFQLHLGSEVRENEDVRIDILPSREPGCFFVSNCFTMQLFGEAEAALPRGNSPRNNRTNGEARRDVRILAGLFHTSLFSIP